MSQKAKIKRAEQENELRENEIRDTLEEQKISISEQREEQVAINIVNLKREEEKSIVSKAEVAIDTIVEKDKKKRDDSLLKIDLSGMFLTKPKKKKGGKKNKDNGKQ